MEEGHIQTTLHVPPDGGYGWSLFCQAFFSTGVWSPPCLCSGCFSGQNLTNLKRLPQKNDYHVRWTSRATTQWKICRVLWNQLYHHWLAHLCILYQYSFSGSWVWSCLWYWDRSCGYQWYLNYQQIFQEKNCSCLCFICFSCGSCGWWRVGSKLPDLEKVENEKNLPKPKFSINIHAYLTKYTCSEKIHRKFTFREGFKKKLAEFSTKRLTP